MHSHIRTTHNINTHEVEQLLTDPVVLQIAESTTHEPLSVNEIAELVHEDPKKVSQDISLLQQAHLVTESTDHHKKKYFISHDQIVGTIHILYALWSDSMTARRTPAQLHI